MGCKVVNVGVILVLLRVVVFVPADPVLNGVSSLCASVLDTPALKMSLFEKAKALAQPSSSHQLARQANGYNHGTTKPSVKYISA